MKKPMNGKESGGRANIVLGLYGTGGFAREVIPLVAEYIALVTQLNPENTYKIYFVEANPILKEISGYPLISEEEFFEIECSERFFNIAIGDSKVRERIAVELMAKGASPMSIESKHSINHGFHEIGEGGILCAQTMITSNAKIGKFFHLNIYSYVAHDCIIGDFVTFAPNVQCNGNVHIHKHAYIGTGAIIKQGSLENPLVIGESAIVGMGAVVTKSVPPYTTVIGSPAKPVIKEK
jgi:sugar O-acyltransferase (sialic acid O-acetyltransferase NeuD family)